MNIKSKITQITLIITFFSLLGKIFGFIREIIIAAYFGTSSQTDAYFIGLLGPDFIREIIAGSILTAVFIPIYIKTLSYQDDKKSKDLLNSSATILILLLISISLLGYPLAPYLIKIIAPELNKETSIIAIRLTRIIFPSIIFMGIASFYGNILNAHKHFTVPSLNQTMLNLGIILGTLLLTSKLGVAGIAIGFLFGSILQFLILLPYFKSKELTYKPSLYISDEFKEILKLWVPLFFVFIIGTANDIVSRSLAAGLKEGNISAINFSSRIRETIWLLCGVPLGTAIFPYMSESFVNNKKEELKSLTNFGIKFTLVLGIPSSIFMILFSKPLVKVVFQRGLFDINSTSMTSYALVYYSIGAVFYAINFVLLKVYYSTNKALFLIKVFSLALITNLFFGIILRSYMNVGGITLARSISDLVSFIILLIGFNNLFGGFNFGEIIKTIFRVGLASVISIWISYKIFNIFFSIDSFIICVLGLVVCCVISVVLFISISHIFNFPEIYSVKNFILNRYKK